MSLKLKTPPVKKPVSLIEIKEDLHIDFPDNDNKLTRLLDSAIALLDGYTGTLGRALIAQQWELYYDDFPGEDLEIPLGNLLSVDLVEYVDPVSLNYTTWAGSNYEVDLIRDESYGWLIPNDAWPSIADTFNATRITFTAGYGTEPANVPQPIRTAISMMVDMWNEGESPQGIVPTAVKALLAPYRLRRPQF